MRCVGYSYGTDTDEDVKDAIITDDRFAMDFVEDGAFATLLTRSTDGFSYKGDYTFKDGDNGQCEFQRFNGKDGSVIMAGKYQRLDEGTESFWFVHLIPSQNDTSGRPLPTHRILSDMLDRPEEYTQYTAMLRPPPKKPSTRRRRKTAAKAKTKVRSKTRAKAQSKKTAKTKSKKTAKDRKRRK